MNERADRPMSVDELAEYLDVDRRVIYRAVSPQVPAERRLPGRKVGKSWRFTRAAVDRWLESGNRPGE